MWSGAGGLGAQGCNHVAPGEAREKLFFFFHCWVVAATIGASAVATIAVATIAVPTDLLNDAGKSKVTSALPKALCH